MEALGRKYVQLVRYLISVYLIRVSEAPFLSVVVPRRFSSWYARRVSYRRVFLESSRTAFYFLFYCLTVGFSCGSGILKE